MSYKHQIFISYKWGGSRKEWVDKVFVPILEEVLDNLFVPPTPVYFKDTSNIVHGATLDTSLQDALAHSVCMISILSLPYFTKSVWCPTEFSAMLYREKQTNVRQRSKNHTGYIFPVIFVDEHEKEIHNKAPLYEYDNLKKLIFNMTPLELDYEKYNNTTEDFKKRDAYNELTNIIRRWVRDSIRPTILNADPWQPEWKTKQYLLDPYETFKIDYDVTPPPMDMPSIR